MPAKKPEPNRLEVNVDDEVDELPPPPPPKTERAPREKSTRQRRDGDQGTATIYVSPGVDRRLSDWRRKKAGRRNLDALNEAITNHYEDLPNIIARSKVSTGPASSIFPANPKDVRYLGGGPVQKQFSPTPEQAKFLDDLGQKLGFERRSTWIAPLLNEFLPGKKDTAKDVLGE